MSQRCDQSYSLCFRIAYEIKFDIQLKEEELNKHHCIIAITFFCFAGLVGCSKSAQSNTTGLPTNDITKQATPSTSNGKLELADGTPSILKEIDAANNKCRDTPTDSVDGQFACEKREKLMNEAKAMGWCWGPQDAFGYEKHWIKCADDPANAHNKKWFAHDINHTHCVKSGSPADKIRELQDSGMRVQTNDVATDTLEVEANVGGGTYDVWTYYRSEQTCERSLPKSQKINSKYE